MGLSGLIEAAVAALLALSGVAYVGPKAASADATPKSALALRIEVSHGPVRAALELATGPDGSARAAIRPADRPLRWRAPPLLNQID
jgi:hypothetical protein